MKTLSILLPSRKDRCIISHGRMNAKAIRLLHNEGQILSHTEHPSLSVQPMVLGTQQISAIIDFHRVEAAFPAVRIYFLTKTRNGSAVWRSSSCPWHWPSQHAHTASSTETAIRDTSWGNFISCLNFQRSQTLICHQKKKKKKDYIHYIIYIFKTKQTYFGPYLCETSRFHFHLEKQKASGKPLESSSFIYSCPREVPIPAGRVVFWRCQSHSHKCTGIPEA